MGEPPLPPTSRPCPSGVPFPRVYSVRDTALGIMFVLYLLFSAWCYILLLIVPVLPFLFVYPPLFRAVVDRCQGSYFQMVTCFFESIFGMKVVLSGDVEEVAKRTSDRVMIVANHRCRFDWMFLWPMMGRYGRLHNLRIILKDSLRSVPAIGWCLQLFQYIFLQRKWDDDQEHLTKMFQHMGNSGYPYQVLLFPEGTDLSDKNRAVGDLYAEKNGLPPLDYSIYPRTKGFVACVGNLGDSLDAIYDVTIAYDGIVPQTEKLVALGRIPTVVHIDLKRHALDAIPRNDDKALEIWLQAQWKRKEALLRGFYVEKKSLGIPVQLDPTFRYKYFGAAVALSLTAIVCQLLILNPLGLFRTYAALCTVLGVLSTRSGHFFPYTEIAWHDKKRQQKQKTH